MATLGASMKLFTDAGGKDFLKFLKGRYKLIHLSNLFFRDVHYGVMSYLELNRVKHGYTNAEELTNSVIGQYEHTGVFKKIDRKTWLLNFPEFKLPVVKPAAAAKPAAPAAKPAVPGAAVPRPTGMPPVSPVVAKPGPVASAPTAAPTTPPAANQPAKPANEGNV